MGVDELKDRVQIEAPLVGHTGRLQPGVGDGDVGIEPRPRRSDGIDRHRGGGVKAVLVAIRVGPLLDAVEALVDPSWHSRRSRRRPQTAAGGSTPAHRTTAR